jgi:hypothetical protein
MQTVQFSVSDDYLKVILTLLNNLKKDMIKDVFVIKNNKKSELENLDRLFENSNNKIKVTKESAIDTNEMIG